jgi:hypothetical protein
MSKPAVVYLPNLRGFNPEKFESIYRGPLSRLIEKAKRDVLPDDYIYLRINPKHKGQFSETLKAVADYEGFIIVEFDKVDKLPLSAVDGISETLSELGTIVRKKTFKPKHVIFVGEAITDRLRFLTDVEINELSNKLITTRNRWFKIGEIK